MTDTDSFIYHIKTKNFLADMVEHGGDLKFDILEALTDLELDIMTGGDLERIGAIRERFRLIHGSLGAMKYEGKDRFISEFVGLAAKMYSLEFVTPDGRVVNEGKGKGVPKRVLKNLVTHGDFKRMLDEPYKRSASFMAFSSVSHLVQRVETVKKLLTPLNNKVFQVSNRESYPLGHFLNELVELRI